MKKLKVKVCGMRDTGNVAAIGSLHPDFIGFICYPPSPRHMGELNPDVVRQLPDGINPVVVTVDMPEEQLLNLVDKYGFRCVQLHGNEDRDECLRLHDRGLFVMKAISVKGSESLDLIRNYEGAADLLVLDTATPGKGGSGKKFDWTILENADINTDFLLSGGISADDIESVRKIRHPRMTGIDINSRFETAPGLKDPSLVGDAIRKLNDYEL